MKKEGFLEIVYTCLFAIVLLYPPHLFPRFRNIFISMDYSLSSLTVFMLSHGATISYILFLGIFFGIILSRKKGRAPIWAIIISIIWLAIVAFSLILPMFEIANSLR